MGSEDIIPVDLRTQPTISSALYEDLIHYLKYATSAYSLVCPHPNGQTLVMQLSNPYTHIHGFIARDDSRKELVVALRGSASVVDAILDTQIALIPFVCPGCDLPSGSRVHSGFLAAWDSIVLEVSPVVKLQLSTHTGYSLVTAGHSLGGALAVFAAVHLKQNFDTIVKLYTYGAPRVGNKVFSEYINSTFGENAYRVVHGNDGVPTMIPRELGYQHHGVEYWQREDPASETTTVKCDAEGEDPLCSLAIPSRGINMAHTIYFGIFATTPFCL